MHDHRSARRRAALAAGLLAAGLGAAACGSSATAVQAVPARPGSPVPLLLGRPRFGSVDGIPADDPFWRGHKGDMAQDHRTNGRL